MKTSDLKIAVHEIPDAGLVVSGELPAEWPGDSLLPAYRALSTLKIELEARRVNENVFVRGTGRITLGFECSRTLQPASMDLAFEMGELYVPEGRHAANLGEGVDAEALESDEPWHITDNSVDTEILVRESMVLAQNPYPVAPGAADKQVDEALPAWTSDQVEVDPRWAQLKSFKLD